MGWFKVDDQLAFHSKTVMAGNEAMGLWVRAGSWASAHLTDGFVPNHMAKAMASPDSANALVMAGLWAESDDGYRFHDWGKFQPSAEEEKAKREKVSKARSDAGKAGAAARWNGKDGKSEAKQGQLDTKTMTPTRPDPTNKDSAPTRRKPEVPLPASWTPNRAHNSYATENGINVDFQAERFRNHAQANDRRARDWDAAFRNWLLKAEKSPTTKSNPLWDA